MRALLRLLALCLLSAGARAFVSPHASTGGGRGRSASASVSNPEQLALVEHAVAVGRQVVIGRRQRGAVVAQEGLGRAAPHHVVLDQRDRLVVRVAGARLEEAGEDADGLLTMLDDEGNDLMSADAEDGPDEE